MCEEVLHSMAAPDCSCLTVWLFGGQKRRANAHALLPAFSKVVMIRIRNAPDSVHASFEAAEERRER
jgi:hypothetical protein